MFGEGLNLNRSREGFSCCYFLKQQLFSSFRTLTANLPIVKIFQRFKLNILRLRTGLEPRHGSELFSSPFSNFGGVTEFPDLDISRSHRYRQNTATVQLGRGFLLR